MRGLECSLQGFFKLVVSGPDGSVKRELDWFPNMILNAGLDRIGEGGNGVIRGVAVGTNNTPPAATDTALLGLVAYTENGMSVAKNDPQTTPYYIEGVYQWTFPQGVTEGNLNEIGIGWSSTALFARSLIKDGSGNPLTLVIGSIDVLTVYYKVRKYPNLGTYNFDFDIGATTHSVTAKAFVAANNRFASITHESPNLAGYFGIPNRFILLYSYPTTLGATILDAPSAPNSTGSHYIYNWSSNYSIDTASYPYVSGSYQKNFKLTFTNTNYCNWAEGIGGCILWTYLSAWQMSWTPTIPKTNLDNLALVFRTSWSRYVP